MQEVIIKYNPYKLKTEMIIDGTNIATSKTLRGYYENLKFYLDSGIPLQTWIEPIPGTTWNGILAELKDDDFSDTIKFDFYGREIDYQDFKRTCESQNEQRKYPLTLDFNSHITLADKRTLEVIEEVKNKLDSEEFKAIMATYSNDSELVKEYHLIKTKYDAAKNNEFKIVFAGLFSSGKSLLVNTLIRHDILPIADDTCTSKICRIVHDGSLLPECSTLECFDRNDVSIVPQESFSTDEECQKRIIELSSTAKNNDAVPKFDYFTVKVNLSHLYPSADMTNEFVLTIVDTPGTNSGKTRGEVEGVDDDSNNLHRQITLEAITNQNKDMVILCFQADQSENESLGDLISTIYGTSDSDRNSFNDRFLFVANKCDQNNFMDSNNGIADRKENIVATLRDAKKLGIKEKDISFVPQVFLTSAKVEYAIQKNAAEKTLDDADSKLMHQLISAYLTYKNYLSGKFTKDDYMLARHSGNPSYVKDIFEEKYDKLMAEGRIAEAISIQTGVPCITQAIKDYLERYAIPFKAAALLRTFDYFIEAVNSQLEEKNRLIIELESEQGENEQQRKGAKEKQEAAQRRTEEKEKIKKEISDAKASVDAISLKNSLSDISDKLELDFEMSDAIKDIRIAAREHREFTEQQKDEKMLAIHAIFANFCIEAENRFSSFASQYQSELQKTLDCLKSIGQSIAHDDMVAKCSITLNSIKDWNVDSLRDDVDKTKTRKVIRIPNPIKTKPISWRHLKDKLKQLFAPKTITDVKVVYTVEAIYNELTNKLDELKKFFKSAESVYSEDLSKIKNSVAEKLETIEREIDQGEQEILAFAEELRQIKSERVELEEKISTVRKQKAFLDSLIATYNFGG